MVGEQSELREAEVPEDLASDPEFALIHGNHLRADAVGTREIGGVDVLFPTRDFVQGAGDLGVSRLGAQVDESASAGLANRPKAGDQIVPTGPFGGPGLPKRRTSNLGLAG